MKNSKKILLLIICILICLLVYFLVQTYAKYLSSASGDTSMKIARWNILVNSLLIKNNTDISNSIVPVFPGNENIAENIIAPTAEGYFDLDFDFTDADVSFKYEITTSVDENSPVKDIVTTGYSIDDGQKIEFSNFNENISDTILLNSNITKRKLRIFVKWNDDEATQTMPNTDDTLSTTSQTPVIFKVNISFTQIAE